VLFLIASHLEVSATLRRDIFDATTVGGFAQKIGTPERLKMLCLLTYADIRAVHPDALTPWKADNIWQLYIATINQMNRSVDEQRFHSGTDDDSVARLRSIAPALGRRLKPFLEGLPQRYLRTYSSDDIVKHVEMTSRLDSQPVQLDLTRGRHWFELTLVTRDRPMIFANLSGALAAWGMNIVKANAFSNQAGTIVDTFYFTDPFRTLELNLPEWERFQRSVEDVLAGRADLDRMLEQRMKSARRKPPKVKIETRIDFDDDCSSHSTLLQVIAQDEPGLLHRVGSRIAQQKCNIEIALIDTEGQMAIDVFYLSAGGAKLTAAHQERLRIELLAELTQRA
jgi:[protein-PII] uridylyltransferase